MSADKAKRPGKTPPARKTNGADFRVLFENSPDPIYILDLTGGILETNRAASEILGYSPEELKRIKIMDIDGPHAAARVPERIRKILNKGAAIFESEHKKRSGAVFPVEVNARLINYMGKRAIIATVRDITLRKAYEERQASLTAIIENTSDAIITLDMDNKVTAWNKGAERIFGYTEAGIIGKPITILAPDPDKADGPALLKKVHGGMHVEHIETKRRRKDGQIIDISLTMSPLRDRDGKVTGVSGAAHDITERKRAEREIRGLNLKLEQRVQASETRYQLLFDNISDTILLHDPQGNFIDINRGGLERLSYSKEEVLGMNLAQFDTPEAAKRIPENMDKLFKTGQVVFESEQRRKDGSGVPVEVNAITFELDGKPAILSVSRDLTRRKRTEEEARRKSAILQTQQEASIDGILMVDKDQKILNYNRRFVEIWGIPQDILESRSDERAIASVLSKLADPEGFVALVRHLYAHTEEKSRDAIALKDGRVLDRYSCGIFGSMGEYYGRIWYFRDITERNRAEETIKGLNRDLNRTVNELRETNKELEAFTYSVSHDLRTPLRHITTFAGLLAEESGDALKDQPRRYLEVLTGSAKKMDKLITSLLAFSKLARAEPEICEFSGRELAEEAAAEIRADSAGMETEWKIGEFPPIKGDRMMLKQVLLNLMSNAVKFSGGKKPARIEVFARNEADETIIGVRDNGIGFDMKHYSRLFGVFQRLHSDKDFEGTGVGLANVKNVISKHGGRVWAETVPDKETTFYFSLPASGARKEPAKD